MYAERHAVSLTTDASGAATGYTPVVSGRVLGVRVVVPGSGGIEATADITITAEATGQAILTLTNQNGSGSYYPRVPTHDTAGAAALYAAGGTAVLDAIAVGQDRIKIVVAQGGDTKACTVHVLIG